MDSHKPTLHPDVVEDSFESVMPHHHYAMTHPHVVNVGGSDTTTHTAPHNEPASPHAAATSHLRMAIVDSNMLECLGLHHILSKIIPFATTQMYASVDELLADDPENFAHYFVSSRIYFERTQFFRQRLYKTIVLINGENLPPMSGIFTLNINRSEQALITDLLQLHSHGHGAGPHKARTHANNTIHRNSETNEVQKLTPREIEVVRLLGKGFINKEIAEQLHISLTTVITHRKNIMTKLNAHSLSDVIIYAVMNGHLDVGE